MEGDNSTRRKHEVTVCLLRVKGGVAAGGAWTGQEHSNLLVSGLEAMTPDAIYNAKPSATEKYRSVILFCTSLIINRDANFPSPQRIDRLVEKPQWLYLTGTIDCHRR